MTAIDCVTIPAQKVFIPAVEYTDEDVQVGDVLVAYRTVRYPHSGKPEQTSEFRLTVTNWREPGVVGFRVRRVVNGDEASAKEIHMSTEDRWWEKNGSHVERDPAKAEKSQRLYAVLMELHQRRNEVAHTAIDVEFDYITTHDGAVVREWRVNNFAHIPQTEEHARLQAEAQALRDELEHLCM